MKNIAILTSIGGSQMHKIHEWIEELKKFNVCWVNISKVIISHKGSKASDVASALGLDFEIYDPIDYDDDRERWADDIALAIGDVDLVCSCGFMYILPPKFVKKYDIINIHPALLPLFPGINTMKKTLDSGMKVAGCTAHFIDAGVDTGPILEQRSVPILSLDDENKLFERIMEQVWDLWPILITKYFRGDYEKEKSDNHRRTRQGR